MKKLSLALFILFTLSSCKEDTKPAVSTSADAVSSAAVTKTEDFDFEKKDKDESCSTEEDLEKQIEKAKKAPTAFKLQGGDPGCATD
ncbi:MAG: hypothetical protein NXH75_01110 [Halobacteriovoraceae bacterium]|nr:hypothetical protein [Halobacteriovoraceae bacterium]